MIPEIVDGSKQPAQATSGVETCESKLSKPMESASAQTALLQSQIESGSLAARKSRIVFTVPSGVLHEILVSEGCPAIGSTAKTAGGERRTPSQIVYTSFYDRTGLDLTCRKLKTNNTER